MLGTGGTQYKLNWILLANSWYQLLSKQKQQSALVIENRGIPIQLILCTEDGRADKLDREQWGQSESSNSRNCYHPRGRWVSLVAQAIKILLVMWKTQVWSLGWEDPLVKGMATHCSILAWRIPWIGPWQAIVHAVTKSHTWLSERAHNSLVKTIKQEMQNDV